MKSSVTVRIVVGVDDSAGAMAAVAWSTAMAGAYRCPITLVHASPDLSNPRARGFHTAGWAVKGEALKLLQRAEDHLRSSGWMGDDPALVLRAGPPVDVLGQVSEGERMLVVGRRGGYGFVNLMMGSTAFGAAEHAKVPTVVVPDDWDPTSRLDADIVLGLDGAETGESAVAFAFDVASRTGSRVHGVHVCQPFDPYLPVKVFMGENRAWIEAEERCVVEQLAGWTEKYPDVEVRHDVLSGHEAGALLGLSSTARMLVVGGRSKGRLLGALVGSVGRALIHHADCPVAVVHKER